jgi:hypothetical protein
MHGVGFERFVAVTGTAWAAAAPEHGRALRAGDCDALAPARRRPAVPPFGDEPVHLDALEPITDLSKLCVIVSVVLPLRRAAMSNDGGES